MGYKGKALNTHPGYGIVSQNAEFQAAGPQGDAFVGESSVSLPNKTDSTNQVTFDGIYTYFPLVTTVTFSLLADDFTGASTLYKQATLWKTEYSSPPKAPPYTSIWSRGLINNNNNDAVFYENHTNLAIDAGGNVTYDYGFFNQSNLEIIMFTGNGGALIPTVGSNSGGTFYYQNNYQELIYEIAIKGGSGYEVNTYFNFKITLF